MGIQGRFFFSCGSRTVEWDMHMSYVGLDFSCSCEPSMLRILAKGPFPPWKSCLVVYMFFFYVFFTIRKLSKQDKVNNNFLDRNQLNTFFILPKANSTSKLPLIFTDVTFTYFYYTSKFTKLPLNVNRNHLQSWHDLKIKDTDVRVYTCQMICASINDLKWICRERDTGLYKNLCTRLNMNRLRCARRLSFKCHETMTNLFISFMRKSIDRVIKEIILRFFKKSSRHF